MKFVSALIATAITLPAVAALAQQATARPATFRTLATFDSQPSADPHVSPDGRFVLLSTGRDLQVYEVATKRMRKLVESRSIDHLEWSRAGDRIAWTQAGDDGRTNYVWTMPMDAKTATPSGPAQRVTPRESAQAAISLDGRWLAYAAPDSVRPGSTLPIRDRQLVVVPITGGPERVLAHIEGGWEYARWSADGKSIYVSGGVVGGKKASITKVYLDGRAPEVVRPGTEEWFPGMTADRRYLVMVPAKNPIAAGDRAIIVDTTGKEVGRVPLPEGTANHYDDVLGDSALVWLVTTERRSIEIGSTNGGRPKQVPVVGESNHAPTWSPDGKRIAFQVRENGRYMLALMNADGTNVRTFRDTDIRDDQWGARWSPDSKYILFSSRDWHRLILLDVAANSFRTVLTDTTARVGNWTWSASSKSIVATMLRQPMSQTSLDEITLTGARRKLLDVASLPAVKAFQFVGDSAVYYRSDSAAFLKPLYGGPTRKLGDIPANTQLRAAVVSPDRRWLAGPLSDAQRPGLQLEVTALASGERRLIDVPFRLSWAEPRFTADSRSLVVLGSENTDTTGAKLFVVPLGGGAPRAVTTVKSPAGAFSVSPDGASVTYVVQQSRSTSLLLVDLRPGLPRTSSASSNR
jgi:Tol biopolymer transport system component